MMVIYFVFEIDLIFSDEMRRETFETGHRQKAQYGEISSHADMILIDYSSN